MILEGSLIRCLNRSQSPSGEDRRVCVWGEAILGSGDKLICGMVKDNLGVPGTGNVKVVPKSHSYLILSST